MTGHAFFDFQMDKQGLKCDNTYQVLDGPPPDRLYFIASLLLSGWISVVFYYDPNEDKTL